MLVSRPASYLLILLMQAQYSDYSPVGPVTLDIKSFLFPGKITTSPAFLDETSLLTVMVSKNTKAFSYSYIHLNYLVDFSRQR